MNDNDIEMLVESAREAMYNAYAPYSEYRVGAALLGANGRIYVGCNVENASYPIGICAERVAAASAVADGVRSFLAIAVFAEGESLPYPCGMCRQFLAEFSPDMDVIAVSDGGLESKKLNELLPCAFSL